MASGPILASTAAALALGAAAGTGASELSPALVGSGSLGSFTPIGAAVGSAGGDGAARGGTITGAMATAGVAGGGGSAAHEGPLIPSRSSTQGRTFIRMRAKLAAAASLHEEGHELVEMLTLVGAPLRHG